MVEEVRRFQDRFTDLSWRLSASASAISSMPYGVNLFQLISRSTSSLAFWMIVQMSATFVSLSLTCERLSLLSKQLAARVWQMAEESMWLILTETRRSSWS